ncbi:MAG: HAD family hydrolase [Candidatus Woesearchaeota archaeon]|jgi:phosphoglycolate phosphatase-like HAD superfamily hydrolase
MLQAIIFDYDGTLCPTLERQESWFKFYSASNKKEWRFENFNDFKTTHNDFVTKEGGIQAFYDYLELPCNMNDRKHIVWHEYERFKSENPMRLYSNVRETIKTLWEMNALNSNVNRNKRLRLGINTTNTWKSIYKELQSEGILPYFDGFITTEILRIYQGEGIAKNVEKPSPISIALMLRLLDSNGNVTIHVGDTVNDLRASKNVIISNPLRPENLITVGACYGYEGREQLEKGTIKDGKQINFDYLIDSPEQLIPIVKEVNEILEKQI